MFTFKKDNKSAVLKEKTVEEKTRIGFRYRERKAPKEEPVQPEKQAITYDRMEEPQDNKKTDDVIEIFTEVEEALPLKENQETEPSKSKKKKTFIKKDMTGKPVYLEDTGEKLGTVFDTLYDKENNLIGYKIKDSKSDAVLSFHFDQFDEEKNGLIFIPGWYTKAVKTIEKLEFKDRISPEFTTLLTDDAVSNEELYEIFVKHDDEMAKHIEGAISLKEMLNNRLKVLEKQRISLKDNLMDLTEKRLIKDIDRREFSEDVMEHRRKVNILDVNINKCRELIRRLDLTSFGILGKNNLVSDSDIVIKDNLYERGYKDFKEKNKLLYDHEIENGKGTSYKEKYYTLKEQFEQLEDDYQELKMAVEKLVNKYEI